MPPEASVFLDDLGVNLKPARAMGMTTIKVLGAAQAIDEGDVANNEIRVRCWAAAGWIHAEVKDTGKGIPPDEMEYVSEPFYSTREDGRGRLFRGN